MMHNSRLWIQRLLLLLGKMTFEFDFRSDSIGAGEETDFEFEFDGRKETRSPRTIFKQFIGKFQDERELSATTSQSCGQGKAQDMVEELKIKEVKIIS